MRTGSAGGTTGGSSSSESLVKAPEPVALLSTSPSVSTTVSNLCKKVVVCDVAV